LPNRVKISLLLNMLPFPADHGAKVDIWRRIVAMHNMGYHLQLICWSSDIPTEKERNRIEAMCDELIILPFYRSPLKKFIKLFRASLFSLYPAETYTYTDIKRLRTQVESFGADIIWSETYTPGLVALKISKLCGIPLFYRSHNVEFLYAKAITDSIEEMTFRERIYRYFVRLNLKRFEIDLRKKSHTVYDISMDDLSLWRTVSDEGNSIWLPPFYTHIDPIPLQAIDKKIDFLFVGNLFMENNISALKWLTESVMPLVHKSIPDAQLQIVGSNPTEHIYEYLSSFPYIDIVLNAEDIEPYINDAKVIVNPALRGSGITIKTIDGLHSNSIWVGTTQAFRGLPKEFFDVLNPAESAEELAKEMVNFYLKPDIYPHSKIRSLCKEYFDLYPMHILEDIGERSTIS